MVIDVFTEHDDLRIVEFIARLHLLELADQVLRAGVLDFGLIQQRLVVHGLPQCVVEDLFLDGGMKVLPRLGTTVDDGSAYASTVPARGAPTS